MRFIEIENLIIDRDRIKFINFEFEASERYSVEDIAKDFSDNNYEGRKGSGKITIMLEGQERIIINKLTRSKLFAQLKQQILDSLNQPLVR
ncbi:MAG: hypothetical protein NHB32_25335 [Fischerella sp. CENA71]|nr:hypothetical protein [Fischerella sp. CENA71]